MLSNLFVRYYQTLRLCILNLCSKVLRMMLSTLHRTGCNPHPPPPSTFVLQKFPSLLLLLTILATVAPILKSGSPTIMSWSPFPHRIRGLLSTIFLECSFNNKKDFGLYKAFAYFQKYTILTLNKL